MTFESVHPRLRGELECRNWPYGWHCGSSPLTRGTLTNFKSMAIRHRFIPAYAGNSKKNRRADIG